MEPTIKFVTRLGRFDVPGHYTTHVESQQAKLAVSICGNIAVALGAPNGEDSAGRAKFKIMPADEVAERACAIAAAMYAQWGKRGWLHEVPPFKVSADEKTPDTE
jgi:hypothetical protein